ncbi:MAG: MFS transporter [Bacteroidota bacterium]
MYKNLRQFLAAADRLALGLCYVGMSVLYGTLFARFPEWLDAIEVQKAEFGLSLLSMSIGALVFAPITSWLILRFRVGPTLLVGMLLMSISFITPVLAKSFEMLLLAMFLLGMTTTWINVAVNAAASTVEKRDKTSILAMCHGMFSIGGVIGAVSAGLIASLGISILTHLSILALLSILTIWWIRRPMLNLAHEGATQSRQLQWPTLPVLKLSVIAFFIVMGEVAVMDWSTIHLQHLKSSPFVMGLGFAGYSLSMAIGRLNGDALIPAIGPRKLVSVGILIGVLGMALAALFPHIPAALAGFTLVGLGFSCVIPTLYGASARVAKNNPAIGITAIATAGILGVLFGRPMLGYIAEYWGLQFGFALLAVFSIIAALFCRFTRFGY